MSDPSDAPHGLGCAGHAALFALAWMGTCTAVMRSAAEYAKAHGRQMTSDNMGLGWPLFVPFVYLGLLAVYWLGRGVFAVVRKARRS